MQKAFHRLSSNSSLCGPCSLGKSLWAQVKNRFLFLTRKLKKKKNLHSSVITVRQSLILCRKQWCRLSLPDPVLWVSGCLAHGRGGTGDRGRGGAAQHPHGQRVVWKLGGTCIKRENTSCSETSALAWVVTISRKSIAENSHMLGTSGQHPALQCNI